MSRCGCGGNCSCGGVPLSGNSGVSEINTPSCDQSSVNPCTQSSCCGPVAVPCGSDPVFCGPINPNLSQCCSSSCIPASPTPFYANVPSCPEDHNKYIVYQRFYTTVKVSTAWNIPVCGQTATIYIPNLASMLVGSNLWNPNYGYFEVTAVNLVTGQVTVINNCLEVNEPAGTSVPACTDFDVTDTPVDNSTPTGPCVAIDFTAPDVDACVDITLTSLEGISVADTLQIGSGFYRVSALKPNNVLTICNDGDGITPGTSVIAKDSNGNYQYCISIIATNPCEKDPIVSGKVLACNTEEIVSPIDVPQEGWVLTGIDVSTNEAQFEPVGTGGCTTFAQAATITIGDPTYSFVVADSSIFAIDDVLEIAGRFDRATVTGASDATHVEVTLVPTPGAGSTIALGTVICVASCCETLQTEIDTINTILNTSGELPCLTTAILLIPLPATLTLPVTLANFSGGDPDDIYYETESANIFSQTFTSPNDSCDGALYAITAHMNVAAVSDFTPIDPGATVYEEIELRFSSGVVPNTLTAGKMVWIESANGILAGSFPASPAVAVPTPTFDQLAPPTSNFYTYHQQDVMATCRVASNVAVTINLFYRALANVTIADLTLDNIKILVSGWVEIQKVA